MKLQKFSLIASAVALCLTATPFAVNAQTISSSPFVVSQIPKKGRFKRLELTDAQKTQITEIRRNTRTEMEKILTPQQVQQLNTARQNRQGKRQLWRNLNLTQTQKTQMRQIMQSQKSQIEAILTAEQKQQLEQMRENKRSRRQQNRSNDE